jgi:tRNA-dihydrouridine synthase B
LRDLSEFEELVKPFEEAGAPAGWSEWDAMSAEIAVPVGPNAHW